MLILVANILKIDIRNVICRPKVNVPCSCGVFFLIFELSSLQKEMFCVLRISFCNVFEVKTCVSENGSP